MRSSVQKLCAACERCYEFHGADAAGEYLGTLEPAPLGGTEELTASGSKRMLIDAQSTQGASLGVASCCSAREQSQQQPQNRPLAALTPSFETEPEKWEGFARCDFLGTRGAGPAAFWAACGDSCCGRLDSVPGVSVCERELKPGFVADMASCRCPHSLT